MKIVTSYEDWVTRRGTGLGGESVYLPLMPMVGQPTNHEKSGCASEGGDLKSGPEIHAKRDE